MFQETISYIKKILLHKNLFILSIIFSFLSVFSGALIFIFSFHFLVYCVNYNRYKISYLLFSSIIRFISTLKIFSNWIEKFFSHKITFILLRNLRIDLFKSIFSNFSKLLTQFKRSNFLNCMMQDINNLDNFYIKVILPIISYVVALISLNLFVYAMHPKIGNLISFFFLFVSLIFFPIIYKFEKFSSKKNQSLSENYRSSLNKWIRYNLEYLIYEKSLKKIESIENLEKEWNRYQLFSHIIEITINSILSVVYFAAFYFIFIKTFEKTTFLNLREKNNFIILFSIFISYTEIFSLLFFIPKNLAKANISIKKISQMIFRNKKSSNFCKKNKKPISIDIQNLYFKYPVQIFNSIDGVSLKILPNTFNVFIGSNGSGKTTLLKLIYREIKTKNGIIKINNENITSFTRNEINKMISVLPKNIHIFNTTLRENLIFSEEKNNKIDKKIIEILEKLNLKNLLKKDKNLDYWIGEGGRKLSLGEIKRIGIARMILKNCPIWILDEPTEYLDKKNIENLKKILFKKNNKKTIILATHYMDWIKKCDQISILENGRILHSGSYKYLIERKKISIKNFLF
ncbi:ATP-binding cassette domain-containing protein [bacterium endosymbiont of Pedicinus badii]|uniref:ATP-binding cassette domain-containing protein n=1 Tax=bacterium endosymbiont of Pedicinus badii TaxID=1719126 RepID=UPI0009BB0004|nr:ATP-binding cassette domain-containing protein [bacterium endosymbiont of Pedicinus badii]OQM34338.1 hypothetical protein AOQ89_00365 [bacterium endosymbiont of Pedicinus badii]